MGWDLVQDPDQEQQGRPGLPGEHLLTGEEEGRHRPEKGEGLGFFGLPGKRLGRRRVPELNGGMAPVP